MKHFDAPRFLRLLLTGGVLSATGIGCARLSDLTASTSHAQFDQLQEGMTSAQARAIMGSSGTESFNGSRTTTYTWQNDDGSRIMVSFQEDRLVSKSRVGYTRRRQDSERLRKWLR